MYFLVEWSGRSGRPLPAGVIRNGLDLLRSDIGPDGVTIGRRVNDRGGGWHGPTFPLMDSVGMVGNVSQYLTHQLNAVLRAVHRKQ